MSDENQRSEEMVVLQGNWGGQIYVVVAASNVRCSSDTLRRLLLDLDAKAWPLNRNDGAELIRVRQLPRSVSLNNGEVWVTAEFSAFADQIAAVIGGRRRSVDLFRNRRLVWAALLLTAIVVANGISINTTNGGNRRVSYGFPAVFHTYDATSGPRETWNASESPLALVLNIMFCCSVFGLVSLANSVWANRQISLRGMLCLTTYIAILTVVALGLPAVSLDRRPPPVEPIRCVSPIPHYPTDEELRELNEAFGIIDAMNGEQGNHP